MNTPPSEAVSFTPEWEMRGLRISKERGPNASFILECESKYPRVFVPVAFVTYKPHAEFIVSAVNSHDALLAACEAALKETASAFNPAPDDDDGLLLPVCRTTFQHLHNHLKAALAAAQPKP